jgi:DNA invertase Pin-like site-specific DNA recombinase
MKKTWRAALYVRVSTAGQDTRLQETELRAYARARGWAVTQVYADRGISGTKDDRPALKGLMAACKQ